ncbi:MAG: hypothetical protein LDL31_02695 [Prosthecobacter sp.]|nr:hypothetical protein [Prosthecobacter sp.]
MSRNRRILNAGGVPFLVLKGFFVVSKGKQPDGDTLSFVAGRAYQSGGVKTNITVVNDGRKLRNVRFQSIDTPEKAQPLGAAARDSLLTALGFDVGQLGLSDTDFTADEGVHKVPGWIATHGMDGNGRALSYVFGADPGFKHGAVVSAEQVEQILPLSANYAQVASGMAFPAFYSNTDEGHA